MAQQGKRSIPRNDDYPPSSGGNVLFTLGLVSVIALLIIGWIMTQGGKFGIGVNPAANNGSAITPSNPGALTRISISPTAVPNPVQAVQPAGPNVDKIIQEYEAKLQKQKEETNTQLDQLRRTYESQITDYKMQINILKDENTRLRGDK